MMLKNTNPSRLEFMDVFRCLGIILMVMGHVGFGQPFNYFIHAFNMPMFFFISGYFYKDKGVPLLQLATYKAKKLLLPYAIFGIGHYIFYSLIEGFSLPKLIGLLFFNTKDMPIAGALWFLTALFFTDLFFAIFSHYKIKWVIIPLVLVGSFFDQYFPYPLPWALSPSFVGLGLYWIGHQVNKNKEKLKLLLNLSFFHCIVLGIITTLLIFTNGYVNMRTGNYAFLPLFWINAILSIFVGISFSKQLVHYVHFFNKERSIIYSFFRSIGKNSLIFVCLNQITILIIKSVLNHFSLPLLMDRSIVLIVSLCFLNFISHLIKKVDFHQKLSLK